MKIFEIPIYAFDEAGLLKKISEWKVRNFKNRSIADQIKNERKRYPYNHIIGYIEIGIDNYDVYLKLYLPCLPDLIGVQDFGDKKIESFLKRKNIWYSSKKVFLDDYDVNGTHFTIFDEKDNLSIVQQIDEKLLVIKACVYDCNKSYYIDFEAYEALKYYVDYLGVYNKMKMDCEK